jgi:ATP-dependent Clp protease ATP-binding subunit ClpC
MFEHFDERARMSVALAQDEARRLGHDEIGTVHLLLGVAGVAPDLLGLRIETVRAAVVGLHGSGAAPTNGMMPFSAEATAAVTGANAQALGLGHTVIDTAHLMLALLDAGGGGARALREAGAIPGEVRERAIAAAGATLPPQPGHERALRDGRPVIVSLDGTPLGDLGHPNVDARLLELLLAGDTAAGRLLREHGIDESRVRAALVPPDARE